MIRIYANSIERGTRSIDSVPSKLRDEVKELVLSEGYEFDKKGYAHKSVVPNLTDPDEAAESDEAAE